jgi:hypothetical protein
MDVVELVTRMGDTILDVEYLPATTEVLPARTLGLVTRTMQRTRLDAPAVARPAVDRRPLAYLALALLAQVAIVLIAFRVAPFERLPHHAVPRVARVTHVPEPDAPPPKPPTDDHEDRRQRSAADIADGLHDRAPATRVAAGRPRRGTEGSPAASFAVAAAHLAKTYDDIHVAEQLAAAEGPPDPDAAMNEQGFGGGGHHFDVDAVAPKETYKVARWAIPTYFHRKGELAPVPTIEWCDDDSCVIEGPLELATVLDELEQHRAEIAQCYREHTGDLEGQIRFRFEVSPEGKVTGTYGKPDGPVGYGTGTVGRCVAKIAARLRWPQRPETTRVFIGVLFRPA